MSLQLRSLRSSSILRRGIFLLLFLLGVSGVTSSLSGCSPVYVLRAGWEEAGILLRREPISELVKNPELPEDTRRKFLLVEETRKYAKETLGLEPKGSFSEYSKIDREVLVWVLSASPKRQFASVTWWFPIVGRVPYKGFFEKEDGIEEAKSLEAEGNDVFLRPSPAFSTLGWFDDPLLSTLMDYDDVSLVNTVIHEILHNTVWIPNHASFNETLANVVGALGSHKFFLERGGEDDSRAQIAEDRWHDELIYAEFLNKLEKRLREFYLETAKNDPEQKELLDSIVSRRKIIFEEMLKSWTAQSSRLKTKRFANINGLLNNAILMSQMVYLNKPQSIANLYESCGNSMNEFIEEIRWISEETANSKEDPYNLVEKSISNNCSFHKKDAATS